MGVAECVIDFCCNIAIFAELQIKIVETERESRAAHSLRGQDSVAPALVDELEVTNLVGILDVESR